MHDHVRTVEGRHCTAGVDRESNGEELVRCMPSLVLTTASKAPVISLKIISNMVRFVTFYVTVCAFACVRVSECE